MERWVVTEVYRDNDAEVKIIKLSGEQDKTYKTLIEIRAAAGLEEDAKVYEGLAFDVDTEAIERIENVSREGIEKIELNRAMEKLPDEAMHRLNRIIRLSRDAHDLKDAFESQAFEDLIKDFPIFGDYRKIQLEELQEELKLPRKTYTDEVDRITSDLHQMGAQSRLQLHQHLKHAFNHPLVEHLKTGFPSIELLQKLILDEIIPNPLKKKEKEVSNEKDAGKSGEVTNSTESDAGDSSDDSISVSEVEMPNVEEPKEVDSAEEEVTIKQGNFTMKVTKGQLSSDEEVSLDDLNFLDD